MSENVTLLRKVLRFGDEEIDISNSELDQHPYPEQYRRVLYAFVRDTVNQCEFYRDRMARIGIKAEQVITQEMFNAIPPLSSGEVSALNDSTLLTGQAREHLKTGFYGVPLEHKLWRKFTSSGSSGLRPKVSYYTREDWEVLTTTAARLHSKFLPLNKVSRMFNCFNAAHVGAKFHEDSFSLLGMSVEASHLTRTTPEAVLDQMVTSGASEFGGFNALAITPGMPAGVKGTSKGTNLDSMLNLDMDNFSGKNIRVIITSGSARDVAGLNLKERVWEGN
jgi:hypothetical protein